MNFCTKRRQSSCALYNYNALSALQADRCIFKGRLESQIDTANLQKHINFLASAKCDGRKPNTPGSQAAREYIINEFKKYGLKPFNKITNGLNNNYIQNEMAPKYHIFTNEMIGHLEIKNVIGYIPAKSDEYLFITAHYDHLGKDKNGKIFYGAEDNSSGVAAILEAARVLSRKENLSKNIVFAATDGEEQGFIGARSLANQLVKHRLRTHSAVINVDGAGAKGCWISIVNDDSTKIAGTDRLINAAKKSCEKLNIGVQDYGENFTDSRAFQKMKIPAITFTWAKQKDNLNRSHVHTTDDTSDKVHIDNVKKTVQVLLETVLELCY